MSEVKNRKIEETKHDKFIRLAERRTSRALGELRLVTQLSSPNYEHTDEEIENIIEALCSGIHGISDAFEIPFVSAVGAAAESEASASVFGAGNSPKTGKPVDEYDVMRSLDLMKKGHHQDAYELLQAALRKQKR
jgi:hypothetical protein